VSKPPVANPKESAAKIVPPSALKIQHIMNAIEESKKNWQPPLSTDPVELQEKKFKERNH
jgi:hypothetical protein